MMYPDGIYFPEFVELTTKVTSELMLGIFDCIYSCIPCCHNFFQLRANFKRMLNTHKIDPHLQFKEPVGITLPPPLSDKMLNRVVEDIESYNHSSV